MNTTSLISVIDDDESVRESLESLLKSVGFQVKAFTEAEAPPFRSVRRNGLPAGKGANIIFDPVIGPQLEALCAVAAPAANIFLYGLLDPTPVAFPMVPALTKDLTFRTYKLMLMTANPERMARAKAWILEHLESGALKPIIARVFPFDQIVEAHRYMESNEQVGKIVVTVP